jgi:uncharacterized protein YdeI (YjbR/CyaY-like superfamily)
MTKNPKVDAFLARATEWHDEAARLRELLLGCGLDEDLKWGKPCYASDGNNIAILQPMKAFLSLMFFKGALLSNEHGALESQGENTRSALRLCFTSVAQVEARADIVRTCVREAIEVERAGLSVGPPPPLEPCPELQAALDADPALAAAFAALTPGRQREYDMHIAGAKQTATREKRAQTCAPKILAGKGLRD